MFLQKLSLLNFKNYELADFEFTDKVNCLVGDNGVGKTNVLDAIYYLSFTKSYFNTIDSQNILHQAPFFSIKGLFERNELEEQVVCGLKRGQKKQFKRNSKEYDRLSEHIGLYPLVIITPGDIHLIHEGSSERRKFLDGMISQLNKSYLECLLNYNRALDQRNSLLKHFAENHVFDSKQLDAWDEQLVTLGQELFSHRRGFLEEFLPIFERHYLHITNSKEQPEITYDSQLNQTLLGTLLTDNMQKDMLLQRTTVGVHKDELIFSIDGHPLKKYGSQGQQKSYVIALKLAQFDYLKLKVGFKPLLLLDDIFEKIDEHRSKELLQMIGNEEFGQVFITDTHFERLRDILSVLKVPRRFFKIKQGEISIFDP